MPNNRDYKEFCPQTVYHVYNRGNAKMNIFLDEEDHLFFLSRLRGALFPETEKIRKFGYVPSLLPADAFSLISYCLMPNHFHLCILQNTDVPISALMSKVATSYSKYFNKKYNRVGSLYQDQFKAVAVLSNDQLLYLTAYIHNNPRKAKLVANLDQYPYSSHAEYMRRSELLLCEKQLILSQFSSRSAYLRSVMNFDEETLETPLRID